MNLVFLGVPGSGKGTQAGRLAKKMAIGHLSTGDLLRTAVHEGTPLGKKADAYMKAGELVPDGIIIGLIEEKMKNEAQADGFVLDGFPRTMTQATALDAMFAAAGTRLNRAILLAVDDDEIIRRLSGRMHCTSCLTGYHCPTNLPARGDRCDVCGGRLIRRPDDEPDVIRHRLEVYRRQTQPIEDYYRRQAVLLEIYGIGTPDEIFGKITAGLGLT
jgi:adenylate kinase